MAASGESTGFSLKSPAAEARGNHSLTICLIQKSADDAARESRLVVNSETIPKNADDALLRMTASVVAAYVSNNALATQQLTAMIHTVYTSLRALDAKPGTGKLKLIPAVASHKSIT